MHENQTFANNFYCIIVTIRPVETLLDPSDDIVSTCMARKTSGMAFLKKNSISQSFSVI